MFDTGAEDEHGGIAQLNANMEVRISQHASSVCLTLRYGREPPSAPPPAGNATGSAQPQLLCRRHPAMHRFIRGKLASDSLIARVYGTVNYGFV
jgi:hypothetical protein